ncbi:hypothetical protein QZH41_005888 [Actinostola sp. cb2023]|nr:hypothetical protein QZH41_005888 [Actinostola sp. cb2023]
MGDVEVECLMDTGSAVSLVTETFYKEKLQPKGEDVQDIGGMLKLTAANGLEIPYIGKKSGALRMCVDYRQLNAKTRRDAYPLPRIEESLDALGGAKHFSTIDLASAYNQVEVEPADRHKTAFTTPMGLFEYTRMPFGLNNSPATFQRLMQNIFRDDLLQILLVYLDDIIVYSSNVAETPWKARTCVSEVKGAWTKD